MLGGRTLTAISAGGNHTCAIADGKAYCWGWNDYGQLGNNTTNDSTAPVAVYTTRPLAGKTITAISAGQGHSCAVADGNAYCWGSNNIGQLGTGTTSSSSCSVPVDTSGELAGKTVTFISAGYDHTCVVADGKAYCWNNSYGQLGNNSTTDSTVPVPVNTTRPLAGRTVTAISAWTFHTCTVADGNAYCWGSNNSGNWATALPPTRRSPSPWTRPGRWPDARSPRSASAGTTPARSPMRGSTAGASTTPGSRAITAPPTLRCRWR